MSKDRPNDPTVLFVDDDPAALERHAALLDRAQICTLLVQSGLHALDILRHRKVHLIVSDYCMPGMNGVALLNEVERLYPEMGRVLYTGDADSEVVLDAVRHKVLTKGMHVPLVRRAILRELKRHGG